MMLSLFGKIVNLFNDNIVSNINNNNIDHEPELEDFITVYRHDRQHKSIDGTVTRVYDGGGVVNGDVYFENSTLDINARGKIEVGTNVKVTATKESDHDAWRATSVILLNDEWDFTYDASDTNGHMLETNNNDISLKIDQSSTLNNSSSLIVIDKVENVHNSLAYLGTAGSFPVNSSFCSFKIMRGDWVRCTLQLSNEIKENDYLNIQNSTIIAVTPLRKKTIRGRITSARRHYYIINNEIYCPWEVMDDINADIGETATLEIIESQQEKWNWRVLSFTLDPKFIPEITVEPSKAKICSSNYDKIGDIIFKKSSEIKTIVFDSVGTAVITIENLSKEINYTLRDVKFIANYRRPNVQLTEYTLENGDCMVKNAPIAINANEELSLELKCLGKNLGYVKQECTFIFDTHQCTQYFEFNVTDPNESKLRPSANTGAHLTNKRFSNFQYKPYESSLIIQGERPFHAPTFLPTKLPRANIPSKLWDSIGDKETLLLNYPYLEEVLDFNNYESKFGLLLHLEELELTELMSQFTIDRACFISKGEYLCLEVPGLSENRPSVMLGDTILASFPNSGLGGYCEEDNVQYEGFVHQVHHSQVYLRFHPSFHSTYAGEDYRIRFCFNRTYFRRCHFAVSFVKQQLGSKVLFPKEIEMQLPQAIYIDSEQKPGQFPVAKSVSICDTKNENKNDYYASESLEKNICFNGGLESILECNESDVLELHSNQCHSTLELEKNDQDEAVAKRLTTLSQKDNSEYKENRIPVKTKNTLFLPRAVEAQMLKSPPTIDQGKLHCENKLPPPDLPNHTSKSKVRFHGRYLLPKLPVSNVSSSKGIAVKPPSKMAVLKWVNPTLNYEQKQAVRRIIEGTIRPLPYVIYGPPGTGKTITVVEAILQILELVEHSRVLVVTPSNSASDLITQRLVASKSLIEGDFVRLNAYQRNEDGIPDDIRKYCHKVDELSNVIHRRITVATAATSGAIHSEGLSNGHFTHLFIDEAGQMTEPESCVALGLVNNKSGQVVLAGDPMQLGPVVFSRIAKKYGLEQSLLERLTQSVLYQPEKYNNSGWRYEPRLVTRLIRNYRSHSDIIAVSSELFYHSSLKSFASSEITTRLLNWPDLNTNTCPVLFHGLVSNCVQEDDSPSWFNPAEAFQVVRYAKSLLNFGVAASDIGIITPYRKQVNKIRLLFETFNMEEDIKVGSVEEFQGQERPAIIISTVRSEIKHVQSDIQHNLGFVSCHKRFNVAITRAESLLIVVGNPHILSADVCWRHFIKYCINKNSYMGPDILF